MSKQLKEEEVIDLYTPIMSTWWSLLPKVAMLLLEVS